MNSRGKSGLVDQLRGGPPPPKGGGFIWATKVAVPAEAGSSYPRGGLKPEGDRPAPSGPPPPPDPTNDLADPFPNRARENGFAILCNPHDVKVDRENGMRAFPVFSHNAREYGRAMLKPPPKGGGFHPRVKTNNTVYKTHCWCGLGGFHPTESCLDPWGKIRPAGKKISGNDVIWCWPGQ